MKEKYLNNNPIDNEILSKGKNVVKDFDDSNEVYVEPKKAIHKLISIRLPVTMIKNLRVVAEKRGDIGYQQIIKTYIAEGLLRDNQNNRVQSSLYYEDNIISLSSSSLSEGFPNKWESGNNQTHPVERSLIWK
jgi:hypothetical protein